MNLIFVALRHSRPTDSTHEFPVTTKIFRQLSDVSQYRYSCTSVFFSLNILTNIRSRYIRQSARADRYKND